MRSGTPERDEFEHILVDQFQDLNRVEQASSSSRLEPPTCSSWAMMINPFIASNTPTPKGYGIGL